MHDRRSFFHRCAGLAAGTAVASAAPALAQGGTLEGIDVSHWQGTINWTSVKNAGITFAVCKCTEGLGFFDDYFTANWNGMKANGIYRSAYHMGLCNGDPIAQARFFYGKVKPSSGDLPLCLDLERDDGMTPTQRRYWTQRFLQELKRLIGKPPMIYVGYYFWRDNAGNSPYTYDAKLWMPRWNVASPEPLTGAWTEWTFWQYTVAPAGSVPGVTTNIDRDKFNGSLSGLQALQLG